MPPSGSSKGGGNACNSAHIADARYTFDNEKLQKLRTDAPWTKDPKYFNRVAVSPSAIMKMMMHCNSGVEKGIAKGGNPIEVMGILLGRPDPDTPKTLVIADAFPLPIEGFETRVIADDEDVVNHMIALGESLERTRKEKFMGWYHSHPFDVVPGRSHCFLSQTDLSTQLQWQRAEDPHGNPFVAVVVDPLTSKHLQTPQVKAFRAYPPEFNSPVPNECPDGSIQPVEQARLESWGSCWNRYYEIQIEYYMSYTSRSVLEQLTQDYLWMRTLCKTDSNLSQQLVTSNKMLINASAMSSSSGSSGAQGSGSASAAAAAAAMATSAMGGGAVSTSTGSRNYPRGVRGEPGIAAMTPSTGAGVMGGISASSAGGGQLPSSATGVVTAGSNSKVTELSKAVQSFVDVASEQIRHASLESTKEQVFSNLKSE